jgi:hypothetical protein
MTIYSQKLDDDDDDNDNNNNNNNNNNKWSNSLLGKTTHFQT